MNEKEQAAFVEAYSNNVASAPSDYVAQFVARYESGEDMPYCEHYTSIMDALGMWHSAIRFNLEVLKMTEQEIAKAIKKQFGNVDKNQSELLARAYGLSEGFYADDDCAWEPFEDWPEEDLTSQVHDLAENIYHAMLWAQKKIIDGPEK